MKISYIVAMDENRGIGIDNRLPWRLSNDLKRFKKLTMGHHIIMGRKTYESIGKALPGRENVVVTRNPSFQVEDCQVTFSPEEAIELARNSGEDEAFIIGGSTIFTALMDQVERIYLTIVHTQGRADTFFPPYDPKDWESISEDFIPADPANEFDSTYKILEKAVRPD